MTPEYLASLFHRHYENLAPIYGYSTRGKTRVPWKDVTEPNKSLMIATAEAVLKEISETCDGLLFSRSDDELVGR